MTTSLHSALYIGSVEHRRLKPRPHAFRYRLFMCYLDLAEIDQVFAKRWLWSAHRPAVARFRRGDYLGDPVIPLDHAVRDRVESETGCRPQGPIRMLTHLRYFGLAFNPVTFYYCFDADGATVDTIVAEITNTPWNERHAYVLPLASRDRESAVRRHRFDKAFHVSPFLPMTLTYDWRFTAPGRALGVHMRDLCEGEAVFEARLAMRRAPITRGSLARALLAFPWMSAQVLAGIYFEALRLWVKRVPFVAHPDHSARRIDDSSMEVLP